MLSDDVKALISPDVGMKLDADRRRPVLVLLPRVLGVALSCHLASRRLVSLVPAAPRKLSRRDACRSTQPGYSVHTCSPKSGVPGLSAMGAPYGVEDAEPDAMECCSRQERRDRTIPEGQCVARADRSRNNAPVAR